MPVGYPNAPMKNFLKRHSFVMGTLTFAVVFVAVTGARMASRQASSDAEPPLPQVAVASVASFQKVNAPVLAEGTVESLEQADLRSQVSAPVTRVYVKIGDAVAPGQTLIAFQSSDIAAQLAQAQAVVKSQAARLQELKNGARSQDLELQQSAVAKAKSDLTDAYTNAVTMLNDAYAKTEDVLENQITALFTGNDANLELSFQISDLQLKNDVEGQRGMLMRELDAWKRELESASAKDTASVDAALAGGQVHLASVRDFLSSLMSAVLEEINLPSATVDAYKGSVAGARTIIAGQLLAVKGQEQAITSGKTAVSQQETRLQLVQAGATTETVVAQEAVVEQAEASVQSIQAQLAKTSIRAPIAGIVAALPVRIGELVTPGAPVVSIVNKKGLQVKAFVSDEDLGRVEEDAEVTVGANAKGKVSRIAPSIDSASRKVAVDVLVTYPGDPELVVGQSVTIAVAPPARSAASPAALLLPVQAVKITASGAFVFTVDPDLRLKERPVTLGSVQGEYVRVLQGLTADMEIVSPVYELKDGQKVTVSPGDGR